MNRSRDSGTVFAMSEESVPPVSSEQVFLMMDYGQFYLRGGLDDGENEYPLLEQALANQPNAGDGKTMVVLSPHQNNFEMQIDVEVFTARPPIDDDQWQQIIEDHLVIGPDGVLQIDSPTTSPVDCVVTPGSYLVQISGRGFVNYGWPGGTTPGDVWRIRLWPADGADARAAIRWDMPGYGFPENERSIEGAAGWTSHRAPSITDVHVDSAEPDSPPAKWITVFHEDGTAQLVNRSELKQQAREREWAAWGGGEPIHQVLSYNGGQELARYDRTLVTSILAVDDSTARRIATWCARAAFDFAGLTDRPWVRPALDALTEGLPLPSPFASYAEIGTAFAQLGADRESELAAADDIDDDSESHSVVYSGSYVPLEDRTDPYDMVVDAPSMAIPSLFSAAGDDPHRAAIETLGHTSHTYAARAAELHSELRSTFPILQKSAD